MASSIQRAYQNKEALSNSKPKISQLKRVEADLHQSWISIVSNCLDCFSWGDFLIDLRPTKPTGRAIPERFKIASSNGGV